MSGSPKDLDQEKLTGLFLTHFYIPALQCSFEPKQIQFDILPAVGEHPPSLWMLHFHQASVSPVHLEGDTLTSEPTVNLKTSHF